MMRLKAILAGFLVLISASAYAANPNREFSVDKTEAYVPMAVKFDASNIKPAKKYYWSFGDGQTLVTTNSIVIYTYKQVGTYTASLKYGVSNKEKDKEEDKDKDKDKDDKKGKVNDDEKDNDHKNLKDAGSVIIKALKVPNVLPVLALNCISSKPNTVECDSVGSVDSDGSIVSYQYLFDDGTTLSAVDTSKVTHSFPGGGNHLVKLTGVDNLGGVSTLSTHN